MDQAMQKLASIIHQKTNVNIQQIPGAGAAGGIAGGMVGFFNGKIISGADLIFDLLKVEEKIKLADMVITGEGKMDKQTLYGKVISKLSRLVQKYDKPLIAVCGDIDLTAEEKEQLGISDAYSLIKWTNNAPFSPQSTILHLREIGTHIANKYLGK
jgi:glycerate kinase